MATDRGLGCSGLGQYLVSAWYQASLWCCSYTSADVTLLTERSRRFCLPDVWRISAQSCGYYGLPYPSENEGYYPRTNRVVALVFGMSTYQ